MIIRRALSEVKKKIRPRPPGGSRFGFKPGPGSRAGGKGFVPVHECRTAGRCDLFGGQLMLTGLQADIGIQLCQGRRAPPDCQLPNDVPYRHPNEAADACFFFIF